MDLTLNHEQVGIYLAECMPKATFGVDDERGTWWLEYTRKSKGYTVILESLKVLQTLHTHELIQLLASNSTCCTLHNVEHVINVLSACKHRKNSSDPCRLRTVGISTNKHHQSAVRLDIMVEWVDGTPPSDITPEQIMEHEIEYVNGRVGIMRTMLRSCSYRTVSTYINDPSKGVTKRAIVVDGYMLFGATHVQSLKLEAFNACSKSVDAHQVAPFMPSDLISDTMSVSWSEIPEHVPDDVGAFLDEEDGLLQHEAWANVNLDDCFRMGHELTDVLKSTLWSDVCFAPMQPNTTYGWKITHMDNTNNTKVTITWHKSLKGHISGVDQVLWVTTLHLDDGEISSESTCDDIVRAWTLSGRSRIHMWHSKNKVLAIAAGKEPVPLLQQALRACAVHVKPEVALTCLPHDLSSKHISAHWCPLFTFGSENSE